MFGLTARTQSITGSGRTSTERFVLVQFGEGYVIWRPTTLSQATHPDAPRRENVNQRDAPFGATVGIPAPVGTDDSFICDGKIFAIRKVEIG